jgi:hypothetical protein
MTTAGTSQFNMLAKRDVAKLNYCCCCRWFWFLHTWNTSNKHHKNNRANKVSCKKLLAKRTNKCVMLLYPERYYDDETIIGHFYRCADSSEIPVIIHAMFMRHRGTGVVRLFCRTDK